MTGKYLLHYHSLQMKQTKKYPHFYLQILTCSIINMMPSNTLALRLYERTIIKRLSGTPQAFSCTRATRACRS